MSKPFLIIGLGNPGSRYSETRHNAGFWFVDTLARRKQAVFSTQRKLQAGVVRVDLHGKDCLLVRPTTFMNHSGQSLRAVSDYFQVPVANLLVAYDELDLPVGVSRLKLGGGHGGHNGLRDIFRHLPDHQFLRLRIGIGHPGSKDEVTGYVLSRPGANEEKQIWQSIGEAIEVLPDVLNGRLPEAMKALHTQADNSQ